MRVCTIEDCGRYHKAHGYCARHYVSWRKYGDPTVGTGSLTRYEGTPSGRLLATRPTRTNIERTVPQ